MCSIIMSVRLSLRPSTWNNMSANGLILMKFDICIFFKNLSSIFKFQSNLTRITVLHIKFNIHFYHYLPQFSYNGYVSDKNFRGNGNTNLD